jgi:hypothetical protein
MKILWKVSCSFKVLICWQSSSTSWVKLLKCQTANDILLKVMGSRLLPDFCQKWRTRRVVPIAMKMTVTIIINTYDLCTFVLHFDILSLHTFYVLYTLCIHYTLYTFHSVYSSIHTSPNDQVDVFLLNVLFEWGVEFEWIVAII